MKRGKAEKTKMRTAIYKNHFRLTLNNELVELCNLQWIVQVVQFHRAGESRMAFNPPPGSWLNNFNSAKGETKGLDNPGDRPSWCPQPVPRPPGNNCACNLFYHASRNHTFSANKSSSASATSAASGRATRRLWVPCSTFSSGPPMAVVTTGQPMACASTNTWPNGSGPVLG